MGPSGSARDRRDGEAAAAYRLFLGRRKRGLLLGLGLVLAAALLSLGVGSTRLDPGTILRTLAGAGTAQNHAILLNIRLPRTAAAVIVGASLALCGCVMQSVLRNPLASASTLGVSQGASFGAAVAIICFEAGVSVHAGNTGAALRITSPLLVTACAFLGGMATTALLLLLSRVRGISPPALALAGVAVSALFSGATTLLQYFADDAMVATVVYWTFGSLGRVGWGEMALMAGLGAAAFLFFFAQRWNYNALESGTATAKSLGVPVEGLVLASMTACALTASVSVAFAGCINFVGLIASHMVRRLVGNDYRFLLPGSALCGAALTLGADVACRTLAAPAVLPIGALTSFCGAPLFLWLILKRGEIG